MPLRDLSHASVSLPELSHAPLSLCAS